MDDAVAAQERALECYRELGDRRSESRALCSLSEMLWCPGRIAESERASRDAVEVLGGLEPGRELARAYVQVASLSHDVETTIEWATRAQHARRASSAMTRSRSARASRSTSRATPTMASREQQPRRSRRRSGLAWPPAGTRGAGRPGLEWPGLGREPPPRLRRPSTATSKAGLAYCAEHDLEIYERYLHAYRARAALDRARWDEAVEAAMVVVHDRGPSIIPPLSWRSSWPGWHGRDRARRGRRSCSIAPPRLAEQQAGSSGCAPRWPPHAPRWRGSRAGTRRSRADGRRRSSGPPARMRGTRSLRVLRWRWRAGLRDDAPDAGTGPMPRRSRATGRRPRACGPSSAARTRRRSPSAMPTTTTRSGDAV